MGASASGEGSDQALRISLKPASGGEDRWLICDRDERKRSRKNAAGMADSGVEGRERTSLVMLEAIA